MSERPLLQVSGNLSQSDAIPSCNSFRMGISNPTIWCVAGIIMVWMGFSEQAITSHRIRTGSLRLQGLWSQITEVAEPLKRHQCNKESRPKNQPLTLLCRKQWLKLTSRPPDGKQSTTEEFLPNPAHQGQPQKSHRAACQWFKLEGSASHGFYTENWIYGLSAQPRLLHARCHDCLIISGGPQS